MTLTNPVNKSNIIENFRSYVQSSANSGIVWGTNSLPTYTWPSGSHVILPSSTFGGTTSGKTPTINLNASTITASDIANSLISATTTFSAIRKIRVTLTISSTGGSPYNSGDKPTPGVVFDQTQKAHMPANFEGNITAGTTASAVASASGISAGASVGSQNLINFFNDLKNRYESVRDSVGATTTFNQTVCHASCHSNCHVARSRR
jgi:hypothetical protein